MTKPALGPIGVASQEISHGDRAAALDAAAELEELGYSTIWLNDLGRIVDAIRVLAALGPRMLRLARDRTSGAFPVMVTPDYTATARDILGDDTGLFVEQFVVDDADGDRARAVARNGPLGFLTQLPQYRASFRRMGFTDDEISGMSDRLVDGLVAWGDPEAIARRVDEHRRAGADQVAVAVLADPAAGMPRPTWRRLAEALL